MEGAQTREQSVFPDQRVPSPHLCLHNRRATAHSPDERRALFKVFSASATAPQCPCAEEDVRASLSRSWLPSSSCSPVRKLTRLSREMKGVPHPTAPLQCDTYLIVSDLSSVFRESWRDAAATALTEQRCSPFSVSEKPQHTASVSHSCVRWLFRFERSSAEVLKFLKSRERRRASICRG